MSAEVLKLVPADPNYSPSMEAEQKAGDLLAQLHSDPDCVSVERHEGVQFVDAGENGPGEIKCPACAAVLEVDWWGEAMNSAYSVDGFDNLVVTLPCCGADSSLNDLGYEEPVAFAKYEILIQEPLQFMPASGPDPTTLAKLESLLGCKFRQVWARY